MYQHKIDQLMDTFDFEKVKRVMDFLDWKWARYDGGVPTIYALRVQARELITEVIEQLKHYNKYAVSTGGFMAQGYRYGEDIVIELRFVVTETETFE